jgi:hypothetical protein
VALKVWFVLLLVVPNVDVPQELDVYGCPLHVKLAIYMHP